ncbi:MAG TPA: MarR family transcriptional regulator [Candidatus Limnocylindria bacterium]|nr:MarR family transcriptional regulator [Candidatus Limnocylindria bacterium]
MSTPEQLRSLIARAIAVHEVVAASLGINATDLRCLELLEREERVTPSRLAELAGLTSGAVTGVLDRLEEAGFVRREADPADRRRFIVQPVPERMADVTAAYRPVLERIGEIGSGKELGRWVDELVGVLGRESERLRVATEGGILDNAYVTPLRDVSRARLVLATGAPRLNFSRTAMGQQVRMVAETAATRLSLRGGQTDGELIRADFVGPPPDVRTSDGSVSMRYRRRMIDLRAREIDAALHPGASWGIEIDGGITDLDGDLRAIAVTGIDVRGGVNHLSLALGRPSGTVRVAVTGGTSDARITRPRGVPVALVVRGGVAHLSLDGRTKSASGTDLRTSTNEWASTPDRYEIEIGGGAAHLAVETA